MNYIIGFDFESETVKLFDDVQKAEKWAKKRRKKYENFEDIPHVYICQLTVEENSFEIEEI